MIHRINVFLLSIILTLSQVFIINSANARTVGGWTLGGGVAQGASVVYNGTKELMINGADYIKKGTAKVTPNAAQVAKVLRGGAAGYALSIAVEQLLGAVDWVLDPANNQIVYTPDASPTQPNPNIPKFWLIQDKYINPGQIGFSNVAAACTFLIGKKLWSTSQVVSSVVATHSGCMTYNNTGSLFGSVGLVYVSNPAYDPAKEEEKKTLPLETVAQKVISNAESGDTNAQAATTTAAADIVAEAETDSTKARPIVQQLESTAQTTPKDETAADNAGTANGESTANPDTGATDLKLEFPVFCNWAPSVCEAAQVVISFPQTLINWWETATTSISEAWASVKEWVKPQEPVETDTKVEVEPSVEPPTQNDYLQWNAYCPFTAKSDDISINGETSALSSDLTSWCTMASEIKPFVLLAGALASLMIVSGVGLGRSED